jgi:hypothetical protein
MIARQETFNSKDEVWTALAAPVPAGTISWRQDGRPIARDGRFFARFVCYIEANTVRERLDTVCPGEWDLTLEMLPQIHGSDDTDSVCAFKARLQVLGVIREDVGTGRDYKQASTDAFKRAAVRFGIANELYSYDQNWVEVDGDGKYARPVEDPGQAYERRSAGGIDRMTRSDVVDHMSDTNEPSIFTDVDAVSCPKCNGRMWDNRLTKRNPKAPDYKCRDRSCDGVLWPARADSNDVDASATASRVADEAVMEAEATPITRRTRKANPVFTDEIPF